MEPRAIPAATRGPQPSPHRAATTAKPDFKTGIEHKNGNTPERHKHLKSLVLGPGHSSACHAWPSWEHSRRYQSKVRAASCPLQQEESG